MNSVVLSLGSNLGNRYHFLKQAILLLSENMHIDKCSSVYLTQPWGTDSEQEYLNCALTAKTNSTPLETLEKILKIEQIVGRKRKKKETWGDRVIDIDLLFYDQEVLHTQDLTLPHPLLHCRRFVLDPLVEVCSEYIHPTLNRTVAELQKACVDKHKVVVLESIHLDTRSN